MGGSGGAGGSGGSIMCMSGFGTDQCPGDSISLTPGMKVCYSGTTKDAMADYESANCVAPNSSTGPDRVLYVKFGAVGSLKAKLVSVDKDFDPTLQVRASFMKPADCSSTASFCQTNFTGSEEAWVLEIDPAKNIPDGFFVIDGAEGKGGRYELHLEFTAPACGDKVRNSSTMEECDDGNTKAGDGCDPNCKFETTALFDSCVAGMSSGLPIPLTTNGTYTEFTSTSAYKDGDGTVSYKPVAQGSCSDSATTATAKDRIYQIKAKADGTVTARVGYDATGQKPICEVDIFDPSCQWDKVLYAVEAVDIDNCGTNCSCVDNTNKLGTQIACSNNPGLFSAEEISFPVKKDRSYFVIVDGSKSVKNSGSYHFHVSLK
jgi:cysteine-rich repeat protein